MAKKNASILNGPYSFRIVAKKPTDESVILVTPKVAGNIKKFAADVEALERVTPWPRSDEQPWNPGPLYNEDAPVISLLRGGIPAATISSLKPEFVAALQKKPKLAKKFDFWLMPRIG